MTMREAGARGARGSNWRALVIVGVVLIVAGGATNFVVHLAGMPALALGAVLFTIGMAKRNQRGIT